MPKKVRIAKDKRNLSVNQQLANEMSGATATSVSPRKRMSRATRAGIVFGVGRISRQMKEGNYAPRISLDAAIYLSATLEYMIAELVEVAGNITIEAKRKTIQPRHVMIASRRDEELDSVLENVIFPFSGVDGFIHPKLLPKKKGKKKKYCHVQ